MQRLVREVKVGESFVVFYPGTRWNSEDGGGEEEEDEVDGEEGTAEDGDETLPVSA